MLVAFSRTASPMPRSAIGLYVSEATVKTHVGRILSKLGLRDRVQAVVAAYKAHVVAPGRDEQP